MHCSDLRNAILWRLPLLFVRADAPRARAAARARAAPRPFAFVPAKGPVKAHRKGRAPWANCAVGNSENSQCAFFPDPGRPAAARARADSRDARGENAANRDFASRRDPNGFTCALA